MRRWVERRGKWKMQDRLCAYLPAPCRPPCRELLPNPPLPYPPTCAAVAAQRLAQQQGELAVAVGHVCRALGQLVDNLAAGLMEGMEKAQCALAAASSSLRHRSCCVGHYASQASTSPYASPQSPPPPTCASVKRLRFMACASRRRSPSVSAAFWRSLPARSTRLQQQDAAWDGEGE